MKVVVLGTGATSGTLRTDGGVDRFVKRLKVVKPGWREDYVDLARVVDDCKEEQERLGLEQHSLRLDSIWTRIDYYSKFKLILGCDYGSAAAIQIRQAVADAYSFEGEIDRLCESNTDFTLKCVLRGLNPGDALISFNWDTVAENILQRALGQELVQAPHPTASSHIRLIKPHGSLSWVHRLNESVCFRDGSRPLLRQMTSDQIREVSGVFEQPLLLGAVPIKSELLEEIQRGQPGLHETIADQWREALDVLSRAVEVEVVGYGFPAEDSYGRFILREAILKRPPGHKLPTVRYYSLQRDRGEFEQAFREIFGPEVNYEYLGKVESAWQSPAP